MSNRKQRGKREEGGKQVKRKYAAKKWKIWEEGEELAEEIGWKKDLTLFLQLPPKPID